LALSPLCRAQPRVAGDWQGTLTAQGAQHRLFLHIAADKDGSLTAAFDLVDQGANGIPASAISLKDSKLSMTVAALHGTYEGTVSQDATEIVGTWSNTQSFELNFKRVPTQSAAGPSGHPAAPLPKTFWDGPVWKTAYQPDLTENEKIAGLSLFWSEVKYNFAWFELLPRDFDWDALYVSYIPKVRATHSTLEYYRVLQELCARLKDAHTSVNFPSALSREVYAMPGVSTRFIEGRVLISEVWDPPLKQDGIVPGLEIVAIDGVPVKRYGAERVSPYLSASTAQSLDVLTFENALLLGRMGASMELTLRAPDGSTLQRSLRRGTSNGAAPRRLPDFEFKMLPGNIAYVALNTFGTATAQKEFERQFDDIAKSRALIFDVRNNSGGNSAYGTAILSHLIEKPTPASVWRSRQYVPAQRAWGLLPGWTGGTPMTQPSSDRHYGNPVVALTSPRTFSAAEDFTADFDIMGRGKIVGEPTAGSTGQPLFFSLPGGGTAGVCTKQNLYPDGRQFVGVGVQPQILVRPTVADFRAGRDTVLDKALDYLRAPIARP
jgi:C-terminal processing protease CtpA/Prc